MTVSLGFTKDCNQLYWDKLFMELSDWDFTDSALTEQRPQTAERIFPSSRKSGGHHFPESALSLSETLLISASSDSSQTPPFLLIREETIRTPSMLSWESLGKRDQPLFGEDLSQIAVELSLWTLVCLPPTTKPKNKSWNSKASPKKPPQSDF